MYQHIKLFPIAQKEGAAKYCFRRKSTLKCTAGYILQHPLYIFAYSFFISFTYFSRHRLFSKQSKRSRLLDQPNQSKVDHRIDRPHDQIFESAGRKDR